MFDEKLKEFSRDYPTVCFDKHRPIELSEEETEQEYFYYICDGFVRLYLESSAGDILALEVDGPGDIVPPIFNTESANGHRISAINLDCLSDIKAKKIPKEDMLKFLTNNRDIFHFKLNAALSYIGIFLSRMPGVVYGKIEARLAQFLIDVINDFGVKGGGVVKIPVELRHRDIASFVGSSREAATIAVNKLKKAGIITHEKHKIVVLNMDKLKKIADR